jgi:DNA-binding transcriptional regulator YiaG
MPFSHLSLESPKPKNNSYLWKIDRYPAHPRHIGEQIKKRRFDLKMTAGECWRILGIDKSTLLDWEYGRRAPNELNRQKILNFLGLND